MPASISWTGAANEDENNWFNAANWVNDANPNDHAVPTISDDVSIVNEFANTSIQILTLGASVKSLTITSSAKLIIRPGGTLLVDTTLTLSFNGTLIIGPRGDLTAKSIVDKGNLKLADAHITVDGGSGTLAVQGGGLLQEGSAGDDILGNVSVDDGKVVVGK